jgi:phosphate starvation-inducible PhoH-like protein
MQMFLTRLGASSKSIVTGDISQTDLPPDVPSGMIEAMALLRDVQGIGFTALTQRDIVRHRLVQDIVDAYEARDNALAAAGPAEAPEQPG